MKDTRINPPIEVTLGVIGAKQTRGCISTEGNLPGHTIIINKFKREVSSKKNDDTTSICSKNCTGENQVLVAECKKRTCKKGNGACLTDADCVDDDVCGEECHTYTCECEQLQTDFHRTPCKTDPECTGNTCILSAGDHCEGEGWENGVYKDANGTVQPFPADEKTCSMVLRQDGPEIVTERGDRVKGVRREVIDSTSRGEYYITDCTRTDPDTDGSFKPLTYQPCKSAGAVDWALVATCGALMAGTAGAAVASMGIAAPAFVATAAVCGTSAITEANKSNTTAKNCQQVKDGNTTGLHKGNLNVYTGCRLVDTDTDTKGLYGKTVYVRTKYPETQELSQTVDTNRACCLGAGTFQQGHVTEEGDPWGKTLATGKRPLGAPCAVDRDCLQTNITGQRLHVKCAKPPCYTDGDCPKNTTCAGMKGHCQSTGKACTTLDDCKVDGLVPLAEKCIRYAGTCTTKSGICKRDCGSKLELGGPRGVYREPRANKWPDRHLEPDEKSEQEKDCGTATNIILEIFPPLGIINALSRLFNKGETAGETLCGSDIRAEVQDYCGRIGEGTDKKTAKGIADEIGKWQDGKRISNASRGCPSMTNYDHIASNAMPNAFADGSVLGGRITDGSYGNVFNELDCVSKSGESRYPHPTMCPRDWTPMHSDDPLAKARITQGWVGNTTVKGCSQTYDEWCREEVSLGGRQTKFGNTLHFVVPVFYYTMVDNDGKEVMIVLNLDTDQIKTDYPKHNTDTWNLDVEPGTFGTVPPYAATMATCNRPTKNDDGTKYSCESDYCDKIDGTLMNDKSIPTCGNKLRTLEDLVADLKDPDKLSMYGIVFPNINVVYDLIANDRKRRPKKSNYHGLSQDPNDPHLWANTTDMPDKYFKDPPRIPLASQFKIYDPDTKQQASIPIPNDVLKKRCVGETKRIKVCNTADCGSIDDMRECAVRPGCSFNPSQQVCEASADNILCTSNEDCNYMGANSIQIIPKGNNTFEKVEVPGTLNTTRTCEPYDDVSMNETCWAAKHCDDILVPEYMNTMWGMFPKIQCHTKNAALADELDATYSYVGIMGDNSMRTAMKRIYGPPKMAMLVRKNSTTVPRWRGNQATHGASMCRHVMTGRFTDGKLPEDISKHQITDKFSNLLHADPHSAMCANLKKGKDSSIQDAMAWCNEEVVHKSSTCPQDSCPFNTFGRYTVSTDSCKKSESDIVESESTRSKRETDCCIGGATSCPRWKTTGADGIFCKRLAEKYPYTHDKLVHEYCKIHPLDDACDCLQADVVGGRKQCTTSGRECVETSDCNDGETCEWKYYGKNDVEQGKGCVSLRPVQERNKGTSMSYPSHYEDRLAFCIQSTANRNNAVSQLLLRNPNKWHPPCMNTANDDPKILKPKLVWGNPASNSLETTCVSRPAETPYCEYDKAPYNTCTPQEDIPNICQNLIKIDKQVCIAVGNATCNRIANVHMTCTGGLKKDSTVPVDEPSGKKPSKTPDKVHVPPLPPGHRPIPGDHDAPTTDPSPKPTDPSPKPTDPSPKPTPPGNDDPPPRHDTAPFIYMGIGAGVSLVAGVTLLAIGKGMPGKILMILGVLLAAASVSWGVMVDWK